MTTSTLRDLVGSPADFVRDIWGTFPYEYRAERTDGLLSSDRIWTELDCGLVTRPFVRLATPGVDEGAFLTRNVANNALAGYPDVVAFRKRFAAGETIVLARPELWCPEIAELSANLQANFRAQVASTAYLAPAGAALSPLRPPAGGVHAFVIQIEGNSSWQLDQSGLSHAFTVTLNPGGGLYLPPGTFRRASIGADQALVLVIEVREVDPRELAEVMLALLLRGDTLQRAAGDHHLMSPTDKISWLRNAASEHIRAQDRRAVVELARRQQQT